MKHAIGVDIGGTSIKAGLVAENGKIIKKVVVKTEAKLGRKRVLGNIFKAIGGLWQKDIVGIGVGCPGPFKDMKRGIIGNTPNLPLHNVNLKQAIEQKFKRPVFMDNDANCYVLCEATFGAAKNAKVVAGLTLGTGVGGGIVIGGRIFHGRGNAGELGHLFLQHEFEYYLGEKGLHRLCGDFGVRGPIELFELAKKGNTAAKLIWQEYGKILGVLIADIVHALDPDCIVIGGGLSNSWEVFSPAMLGEVKRRCLWQPGKIVKARHQESGILGAAQLVFKH